MAAASPDMADSPGGAFSNLPSNPQASFLLILFQLQGYGLNSAAGEDVDALVKVVANMTSSMDGAFLNVTGSLNNAL